MGINGILRSAGISLTTTILALALGTCGGSEEGTLNFQAAEEMGSAPGRVSLETAPPTIMPHQSLDEALKELEKMECPEGVDAELWVELKDALGEAIICRAGSPCPALSGPHSPTGAAQRPRPTGGKFTSAPPAGYENRVLDLDLADHGDGAYTLTWRYRNLGDYDQNGTVGISDITPLAMHYGEDVPDGDPDRNSIQAVVDGSENGVVDIADITPIAMNYGTCCAEYSIRSAASHPESVDETTEIDAAPIDAAEGDDRKSFSVEIVLSPYSFIAVTPVDEEEAPGALSNVVMTPNHPPVAALSAEPTEGDAPLDVSFDASGSNDIDGPIARYEWDWEGDGVFDHDSGTDAEAEHTYDIADYYDPQVRVTDEHNGTDTASVEVWAGTWHIVVAIDNIGGAPPLLPSLEVVNGHPAISLHCGIGPEEGFWYVRANDAIGESWGAPVLVDDPWQEQNLCGDSLLAVANGYPAIAYINEEERELWYARANDADGSSWGTPQMVCGIAAAEENVLSMAIVNGHPAIAYYTATYMCYVRALDANGDNWPTSPIDTPAFRNSPSLLVVNGKPAICCSSSIGLQYARALDADGTTWGDPVNVDSEPYAGRWWSSMAIVNGNPAICYEEDDNDDLKYVRALDDNGSTWGAPLTVDSEGDVGNSCSLAVIHGYPAIAYLGYDDPDHCLKYVKATDADGSNWRTPAVVIEEGAEDLVGDCSLQEVNGHPAISYLTNTELRFAIYY